LGGVVPFVPIINHNANHLQVFAESDMGEKKSKIGVRRSAKETLVKIDGSIIRKMSDIAVHTPVQIITPKSHEMLERGPEFRRRFVEWGVFHVEHSYTHLHKRFLRVLEQRNATLKRGDDSIQLWDREFVKAGEDLNSTRFRYFQGFLEIFDEEKQLFGLDDIQLNWKQGWKKGLSLETALELGINGDRKMGFTHSGPHRADLEMTLSGNKAINVLSRGQQKLLVIALNAVQAKMVKTITGKSPIILMDDLASELDDNNRKVILDHLVEQNCQCFITGTNRKLVDIKAETKLFHVEHGEIVE